MTPLANRNPQPHAHMRDPLLPPLSHLLVHLEPIPLPDLDRLLLRMNAKQAPPLRQLARHVHAQSVKAQHGRARVEDGVIRLHPGNCGAHKLARDSLVTVLLEDSQTTELHVRLLTVVEGGGEVANVEGVATAASLDLLGLEGLNRLAASRADGVADVGEEAV